MMRLHWLNTTKKLNNDPPNEQANQVVIYKISDDPIICAVAIEYEFLCR